MKKRFARDGRYKPHQETSPTLFLSGRVFLKYENAEALAAAEKGDVMLYLSTDSQPTPALKGNYFATGYAGHFRAEVFDGKGWKLLSADEIFPEKVHHYARHERAHDRYLLCKEVVESLAGRGLIRTYREHYRVEEE